MGYLERNVMSKTETVELTPQRNKIILVFCWIIGIFFIWLLFIPTLLALRATLNFLSTEYLITDKRVMTKYGIISTKTNEMQLDKIENVVVKYTVVGKIFNYGDVTINGANRNYITFFDVKNAEKIKKRINDLI